MAACGGGGGSGSGETNPQTTAAAESAPAEASTTAAADTAAAEEAIPEGVVVVDGDPPRTATFDWGEFELAPRIAEKLDAGEPINVGFSMEGKTIPVYGAQYEYGFGLGLDEAKSEYGLELNGVYMGPVEFDTNEQIAQIRSALAADQVDCLTIEPGALDVFIPVIQQAIDMGVPVFTTGTDVPASNRFATFHTDWVHEGELAAQSVVDYFNDNGLTLDEALMTTSNIDAKWAQDRMEGFSSKLKELVPDITIGTPTDALMTGYDPGETYSKVRAYVQGHPGVDIVYQTDGSAETIGKVITDRDAKGKLFVTGHNVSLGILGNIENGIQISTIDQDYESQSHFPALACSAYLTKGWLLPNTNDPVVVTTTNLEEARKHFIETTQPK